MKLKATRTGGTFSASKPITEEIGNQSTRKPGSHRKAEKDGREVLPDIESGQLARDDMIEVIAALRRWEYDGTWSALTVLKP